jgi:hypothetical protein
LSDSPLLTAAFINSIGLVGLLSFSKLVRGPRATKAGERLREGHGPSRESAQCHRFWRSSFVVNEEMAKIVEPPAWLPEFRVE